MHLHNALFYRIVNTIAGVLECVLFIVQVFEYSEKEHLSKFVSSCNLDLSYDANYMHAESKTRFCDKVFIHLSCSQSQNVSFRATK
jgi:hypothetical protein